MGRIKDIKGQRFGMLLVQELAPRQEKKQSAWYCLCDCGTTCIKRGTALRFRHVISCGCMSGLAKEIDYFNSLLKWLVRMYIGGAKSRDLPFELSHEEFLKIIQNPCHYCGAEGREWADQWRKEKLTRMTRHQTKTIDWRAGKVSLIGNGIDRLSSDEGYTLTNCVPCCFNCNWMKKTMTETEFLNHISKIYNYRNTDKNKTNV